MAGLGFSSKRLQIDKANALIIGLMAGASFVAVFCLLASRALLSQHAYQSKVIDGKETAVKQLQTNAKAVDSLKESYQKFVDQPVNLLGGSNTASGERDGDNARLVLDALPSKYDFPALTTSLEKILTGQGFRINSISGTDDEIAQSKPPASGSALVEIPFKFSATGTLDFSQKLMETMQHSIRPFNIQILELTGGEDALTVQAEAKTYYLPEKTLTIEKEDVK